MASAICENMRPLPKLTFGEPENGWLPIRFGNHEIHASDVPCDSIQYLISRLTVFLSGSRQEKMEWSLEPAYQSWIFKEENGVVSWEIANDQNEMIQAIHSSRYAIVRLITKALKDLYASHFATKDQSDQHWSWSFPIEELTRLETKLADQVVAHNSGGCAPSA